MCISRNYLKYRFLGSKDLRLSLAGAQEKISLAYYDESWHIPKNGAPSTHILKPTREGELNSIAYNEFFCMNLADLMGLPVPKTSILDLCESQIFVCERYDRKFDAENKIILRIHQEDFCQALGIMNDIKYQADGGPSYKNCLDLITNKFSDKIVHINMPFDKACNPAMEYNIHPKACFMSRAAIVAGKQGNYWEMSSLLYENQPKKQEEVLKLVEKLGLDKEQLLVLS